MKVVLYSTHCGHCKALAMLLSKKNIAYEEVYVDPDKPEEVQKIKDLGLLSAPALVVDGKVMAYPAAVNWVKEQ